MSEKVQDAKNVEKAQDAKNIEDIKKFQYDKTIHDPKKISIVESSTGRQSELSSTTFRGDT